MKSFQYFCKAQTLQLTCAVKRKFLWTCQLEHIYHLFRQQAGLETNILVSRQLDQRFHQMFLGKRLADDRDYGLSLFKPNTEACKEWLDPRAIGSVVYAYSRAWQVRWNGRNSRRSDKQPMLLLVGGSISWREQTSQKFFKSEAKEKGL